MGRQKGGGGARRGDLNSPVLYHGGRVFGPRPRDYRSKLNKKMKALARRIALTSRVSDNKIIVIENFKFDKPQTKQFINISKSFKLQDKKVLLVMPEGDENVLLSVRNIPNAMLMRAVDLNAYSVLNNDAMLVTEDSVAIMNDFK